MNFPSAVILDEDTSWKSAAGDDEDDCDAQICHDDFLLFLVGSGNLDLGCQEDEAAEGEEKPLIYEEPFECGEVLAPFSFWLICAGHCVAVLEN